VIVLGDDDDDADDAESKLVGYFPLLRDHPTCSGVCAEVPDDEMSVWRTLLHSDDGYNDVETNVKYKIASRCPCAKKSYDVLDRSLSDLADDNAETSNEEPLDTVGENCSEQGSISLHCPVRSQSDSSLGASKASVASQKSRSLSISCITTPLKAQVAEGEFSCPKGGPGSGQEVVVTGNVSTEQTTVSSGRHLDECQTASMSTGRHLDASRSSFDAEENHAVGTSPSDITVAIRSELPGDAASTATGVETVQWNSVAEKTEPPSECNQLGTKADPVPPPRVVCMDHQVCGLLADFVAHL